MPSSVSKRVAFSLLCCSQCIQPRLHGWRQAPWIAEMYGYSFGAAEVGVAHVITHGVVAYPSEVTHGMQLACRMCDLLTCMHPLFSPDEDDTGVGPQCTRGKPLSTSCNHRSIRDDLTLRRLLLRQAIFSTEPHILHYGIDFNVRLPAVGVVVYLT